MTHVRLKDTAVDGDCQSGNNNDEYYLYAEPNNEAFDLLL